MIFFPSHGPHSSKVKRSQAALMTLATCAKGIMVKREIESEKGNKKEQAVLVLSADTLRVRQIAGSYKKTEKFAQRKS